MPTKGAREARPFAAERIFCTFSISHVFLKMAQVVFHTPCPRSTLHGSYLDVFNVWCACLWAARCVDLGLS